MNRRTFLRALAAGALGIAASARADERMNPAPPLRLRAEIQGGRLRIDYALENPTATDLYLYTGLADSSGVLKTPPGVEFAPGEGIVTIFKLPNPAEPAPLIPEPLRALVTPVRAGMSFVDRLELGLPLREYRAYAPASASCRDKPGAYRGLRVSVGCVWSMPGLSTERVEKIGTQDVVQPIFPLGRTLPSGTLLSNVVPLAVPVVECG